MPAKVIFLNGPSSSGKSTLARELQSRLEEPFWHYSIDHFRGAQILPDERIRSGEFHWSGLREAFFQGFQASVGAFAQAGNNLILEHILEDQESCGRLRNILRPFDVYAVGLRCSPETLVQRELRRGDRTIGDAVRDAAHVHTYCQYDLEIDTDQGLSSSVSAVMEGWRRRGSASVFFSTSSSWGNETLG